ncbi:sarcalumenin [Contarinia nasturtii]|uniref:sarcalumenin n=1 Tax=Contarinia nasturtii TaxID=265458 RepID=UPI0012D404A1|nr:sarcalumenin [Contarinia nasturtii]XP_031633982.1 sarcalumenin [Contarinia nasturtii]
MASVSIWRLLCIALLCTLTISTLQVNADTPTEAECKPHIDKALHTLKGDSKEPDSAEIVVDVDDSNENTSKEDLTDAVVTEDDNSEEAKSDVNDNTDDDSQEESANETETGVEDNSTETDDGEVETNQDNDSTENDTDNSKESDNDAKDTEGDDDDDNDDDDKNDSKENDEDQDDQDDSKEQTEQTKSGEQADDDDNQSGEADDDDGKGDSAEAADDDNNDEDSKEQAADDVDSGEKNDDQDGDSKEKDDDNDDDDQSKENEADSTKTDDSKDDDSKEAAGDEDSKEKSDDTDEDGDSKEKDGDDDKDDDDSNADDDDDSSEASIKKHEASETEISPKSYPVDDLLLESEIPENLRDRSHIDEILQLNDEDVAENEALAKVAENTLKDLKKIYENAIKPLETLYKYRDLSNRHFGDPEIFSKPLVLLMGPWSGGKSTIINYLTGNEYTDFSLKTGAEPSLPYFNILMHGESEQVLDGTQLSADWTFSGLQKFGQGLTDRLRGLKLPSKLLEKVNIVEIPGILEVRKHVSRIFPFNDACQWFIDRADIIFLTYDPSKLDVGPETEAILDQLKGREYQTRIVLNKADQVHPEELLRVQSALIWNISPLMSSQQPPVMYTVSLWSHPFEENTPIRLLQAQEKALLQDLSQAIEHRIENKIASARRFAVRVRNHAKMVDCYLTTYYNHKTLFGNKKKISGEIIEHPQTYHIYEGLSTLTNISRYDLPDPEVYRDFFKLNPLYEFKKLSETCTYFRGCPINKLDVSIAYDLPELVNRYKRAVAQALNTLELSNVASESSQSSKEDRR